MGAGVRWAVTVPFVVASSFAALVWGADMPARERAALEALYASTNGAGWANSTG